MMGTRPGLSGAGDGDVLYHEDEKERDKTLNLITHVEVQTCL